MIVVSGQVLSVNEQVVVRVQLPELAVDDVEVLVGEELCQLVDVCLLLQESHILRDTPQNCQRGLQGAEHKQAVQWGWAQIPCWGGRVRAGQGRVRAGRGNRVRGAPGSGQGHRHGGEKVGDGGGEEDGGSVLCGETTGWEVTDEEKDGRVDGCGVCVGFYLSV